MTMETAYAEVPKPELMLLRLSAATARKLPRTFNFCGRTLVLWLALSAGALAQPVTSQMPQAASAPAPMAPLPATGISLTKVAIEGGRLVVEGKTLLPGMPVTVDRLFNKVSTATKTFAFSQVYLPTDCVIELKVGLKTDLAVVSSCGPKGVNSIGPWAAATTYQIDDLVSLDGRSWRARRTNLNKLPNV